MLRRHALAAATLAAANLSAIAGALGQETVAAIDFVLRPTQEIELDGEVDDIWNWDSEPEPSLLETPIGPPLAGPTGDEPIGPPLAGPSSPPAELIESRIRRTETADPFAQTGVNLGSFVIRPSIEIGVSATDNASGSADKVEAVGLVVAPEIDVRSDGERYQFEAFARGEGIFYDREEFDEKAGEARAKLRYDLTSATSITAEAGYARFLEGFSDPDTPDAAAERPAVDNIDAALGVEQRFGRLSTRVTGFVERAMHEEVPLVGGGVADRTELDNTEFGVRVRAGYATSASLRPFTEAAVGRREFDNDLDDSGFARASIWGELRGGLVIDRGEKLSGEVSVGYRREDLEDDRLEDLDILLANAAILWSPRRLTEVRLDFSTDVNPTSTPDASANILYAGTLTLAQHLSARVRAEIGTGFSYERRIGDSFHDLTLSGFAGASYAFSRTLSLEGRYVYERTDRNEPDGEFDAHEVGVRIRLQR